MEAEMIRQIPVGRMGERADIALACVYLSSAAASFVSGEPQLLPWLDVIVADRGVQERAHRSAHVPMCLRASIARDCKVLPS